MRTRFVGQRLNVVAVVYSSSATTAGHGVAA
jgi:hypothetical protein